MDKCIRILEFAKQLFADQTVAQQASQIMQGIMAARSPRLSDIAAKMAGQTAANYKRIQRFLRNQDPHETIHDLWLFHDQSPILAAQLCYMAGFHIAAKVEQQPGQLCNDPDTVCAGQRKDDIFLLRLKPPNWKSPESS